MRLAPARALPGPARATVALSLYVALGLLSFLPLSLRARNTIAYVGDSLESVYIVAWNIRQAFRAPAHLFQANVLHPHANALAFTDHRLLPSLAVSPVLWATGNAVLATNLSVLLVCLVAAMGARRLSRVLGLGVVAAWAAGALYAFHTYQVNEAPRLNIVAHGFLAWALVSLLQYLKTGERRHAAATAGFMLLLGLSSNYHLLYGVLVVALLWGGLLLSRPRLAAARLLPLALAGVVAAALFLPVAWPYVKNSREHGYARELPAGIDLRHYVSTSPGNLIYGPIGLEVRLQQRGPHFVGFFALALALGAVLAACRRDPAASEPTLLPPRLWVLSAFGLAVLFVLFSLGKDVVVNGHTLGPGPYRLLHAYVPGFTLVRIPERLALVAMLFIALLTARGLHLVGRRFPVVAALLALVVPLEHVSLLSLTEQVPVGRRVPDVYRWLATHPAGVVAEVPIHGEGLVREETLEMYFSTVHWRRTIHGYTAFPPLLTRELRRLAAQFPHEVALQAFARVGVDTVVVHHGRPLGLDLARRLRDTGGLDPVRFETLLRRGQQDLFGALPRAVATGRVRREARFDGGSRPLYRSTADEVYRLGDVVRAAGAPFPKGQRVQQADWSYRSKGGDPLLAADGNLATDWLVPWALRGDELYEIVFPNPTPVTGIVLRLRRDSVFPTRFRVAGRRADGRWVEQVSFDDAHQLQFLDTLLAGSRQPTMGFALSGQPLNGVSLLVDEGGTSFEGWRIPEIEVWAGTSP